VSERVPSEQLDRVAEAEGLAGFGGSDPGVYG
jgi:hypothetical protein